MQGKLIGLINVGTFQISEAASNYLLLSMYEDGKNGEKFLLERIGKIIFTKEKIMRSLILF